MTDEIFDRDQAYQEIAKIMGIKDRATPSRRVGLVLLIIDYIGKIQHDTFSNGFKKGFKEGYEMNKKDNR